MSTAIKFGTSGWRGIIARDFTFDNLRVATQGIAEYLSKVQSPKSKVVILGHDTRFLGREFSLAAAEVLALLQRLNREFHKTIIMVTHDPHAAQAAGAVLHLDKGVLSA